MAVASSTYAGRRIPTSTVETPGVLASVQRAFCESVAPRRSGGRRGSTAAVIARLCSWLRRPASARNASSRRSSSGTYRSRHARQRRARSPVIPPSSAPTTCVVRPRTCHSICSQYVTLAMRPLTPASWSAQRRKFSGLSLSGPTRRCAAISRRYSASSARTVSSWRSTELAGASGKSASRTIPRPTTALSGRLTRTPIPFVDASSSTLRRAVAGASGGLFDSRIPPGSKKFMGSWRTPK